MVPDNARSRGVRRFTVQTWWAGILTVLFLAGLALPGIVFFTDPADYAILHTVLEFTSMAISLMVVALAWNLRHLENNSQIMLVGWISLGVLIVDLAHTLSFQGMPALVTESTPQKAITFWLAGRIIAAVGFLLIAVVPTRHWPSRLWFPVCAAVTVAALVAVWIGIFHTQWVPTFFVPGEGLTLTKRVLEYVLSTTYGVAALLLLLRARREASAELAWLATAAWTLALAELYFTLYGNITDVFNLMGHILKVIAYAMVYRAIFVAGVQDPYRRLTRETSLLRSLIDSVPDLISFTDQDGRLLGVNRAFSSRFHIEPEEAVGRSPVDVAWTDGGPAPGFLACPTTARGSRSRCRTVRARCSSSTPCRRRTSRPRASDSGVIEVSRDVTAQRRAEERIHHLALYDQLTGLPNRVMLGDVAAESFADPALAGRPQALVFLDLDDFKTINDTVGHRVGDLLIQEAARRLSDAAGADAHVARLGGDEFAVLAAPSSLTATTELVSRLIAAIDQPFRIERYDLALTASAGIAMFPTDGTAFDELVVRADAAMYRAKQEGRHTYRFFSGDMLANAAERLELLSALRKAVENDELVVHYQPQVSLADDSIVGVEALVRWQHPSLGLVQPGTFIGLAEDSGLILPIGEAVLNRALADAVAWEKAGGRPITVSVNLSAVQFVQTDLAERIRRALLRSGFPPERLELEITETIAMVSPEMAVATIERLHRMGVQVSIDDFGTGYSSMAYLKRFRIDKLKIDRSFVQDLGRDPDDEAIVTAVIHMAKSLRCVVIAEGVETHEQQEFLRSRGVRHRAGLPPAPAHAGRSAGRTADARGAVGSLARARHHVVAQQREHVARRPLGQVEEQLACGVRPGVRLLARVVDRRMGPQQGERLRVLGVVLDRTAEQLLQAGVGRLGTHQGDEAGERGDALAQVRPGSLARLHRLAGDVDQVVGELERHADALAERRHGLDVLRGGARHERPVATGRGDERAGLVGDHLEVVLDGILAVTRTDRLADLALAQPLERVRLDPDGLRAEIGEDARRAREEEVPGEDGDGVVPPRVRRRGAPAQLRLVHHVVVVERRQMGELDDHAGRHDPPGLRVPELRGEEHEQGPEPLATGVHEVPRGVGHERVVAPHGLLEARLDLRQPRGKLGLELPVG